MEFEIRGDDIAVQTAIDAVATPRYSLNFAPTSQRDALVFGGERPGHVHPTLDTPRTPRGPNISPTVCEEWVKFMKAKGIKRVLCLLHNEELSFYDGDLLGICRETFSDVTHAEPSSLDMLQICLGAFKRAEAAKEAILVFCASGQERTGNVQALWLHSRYNISVDDAVAEVKSHSLKCGARRNPTTEGVVRLLAPSQKLVPPLRTKIAFGTPRVTNSVLIGRARNTMHITFLQMGGTIDKDIPSEAGYAFEVGEPAVAAILNKMSPVFSYDVVTVCRKDSRNVTGEDRLMLHETLVQSESSKLIITHGLTTILETAKLLVKAGGLDNKVVILTGAMRPAKYSDSDATFNIAVAIGAVNIVRRGIYVAMNGRIYEGERCTRDPTTGVFIGENVSKPGISRPGGESTERSYYPSEGDGAPSSRTVTISDDDEDDDNTAKRGVRTLSVSMSSLNLKPKPTSAAASTTVTTTKKTSGITSSSSAKSLSSSMPQASTAKATSPTAKSISPRQKPSTPTATAAAVDSEDNTNSPGKPMARKAMRARKSSSEKKTL